MRFEICESLIQNLTFDYFSSEIIRKGIKEEVTKKFVKYFISKDSNNYTNLAFLLSDQCDVRTTIEIALDNYKIKRCFKGSIVQQLQLSIAYLALSTTNKYKQYRKMIIKSFIDNDYFSCKVIKIKVASKKVLMETSFSENILLKNMFTLFGFDQNDFFK